MQDVHVSTTPRRATRARRGRARGARRRRNDARARARGGDRGAHVDAKAWTERMRRAAVASDDEECGARVILLNIDAFLDRS